MATSQEVLQGEDTAEQSELYIAFELGDKLKWSASQSRNAVARSKLSLQEKSEIVSGLDHLAADPWAAVATLPIREALPGHKILSNRNLPLCHPDRSEAERRDMQYPSP